MGPLADVFKAYDIRGLVPEQLDAPSCRAIGGAFARFCGTERVVVARDMRSSGVELSRSFIEGVNQEGTDVVELGLASTDLMYFASGYLDAPGAMFTASHNPAAYNGIKMCLAGAKPVGQDTGLDTIRADAQARLDATGLGETVAGSGAGGAGIEAMDLLDAYARHVRSFVDIGALLPLRVVADTANGMGGLVVPAVLGDLGLDLEILYGDLDGNFPNHPADPIQPENQVDLKARVAATRADVGLAFDGDADRVFLVDENSVGLSGSATTAMVAKAMLAKKPGSVILYNLICSRTVPEVIHENGGQAVRTRVGHSFIKATMAQTGASFGGEHSGHYYFADNYRADSGLIAALIVLELMSTTGRPLSELRQEFERYADSGEINTEVADPGVVIEAVATHFAQVAPAAAQDRLDGLTLDMGDWWFNLRPSNTEPLLRLNLEAATPAACESRTGEIRHLIAQLSAGTTGPVGR